MGTQDGLEWVTKTFSLEPRWTREPDTAKIELIARKHFKLEQNTSCTVKLYAQGAFNKLYKVETESGNSLMRVTLPVDTSNKTNSEVATINSFAKIPMYQCQKSLHLMTRAITSLGLNGF